ncbi:MAG: hypothetical protein NXI04_17495 [Planctomycetaceae bacterium]|nr:hypothetical protein [Planctomycetaceae bacterium]
MSDLIAPIDDYPIKIERIEQDRTVDDLASTDDVTQTRKWNIFTNDTTTELTVFDVMEQVPIFRPGVTIGRAPLQRRLTDMRLRETESNYIYTLECDFSLFEYKTPFLVPIDWTWESTILEIPAYVDNKGRPIVTTAGEPISGMFRRIKCWIISGTRNVPGVPDWFREYGVSVNKDSPRLDGVRFKPKELQLQKMSLGAWQTQTINGKEYRYRPLSFEFWFNPLTWTTEVFNLGYNELIVRPFEEVEVSASGKETVKKGFRSYQVRATDGQGNETRQRVFLNKLGQRPRQIINREVIIKEPLEPKDIITLKFDLDEELPYARLLK